MRSLEFISDRIGGKISGQLNSLSRPFKHVCTHSRSPVVKRKFTSGIGFHLHAIRSYDRILSYLHLHLYIYYGIQIVMRIFFLTNTSFFCYLVQNLPKRPYGQLNLTVICFLIASRHQMSRVDGHPGDFL